MWLKNLSFDFWPKKPLTESNNKNYDFFLSSSLPKRRYEFHTTYTFSFKQSGMFRDSHRFWSLAVFCVAEAEFQVYIWNWNKPKKVIWCVIEHILQNPIYISLTGAEKMGLSIEKIKE